VLSLGLSFVDGTPAAAAADPNAARTTANVEVPPSDDGLIHLRLIPGANEARYTMRYQSIGQAAPKSASCTTREVTGDIVLTPDGTVVPELSKITVDMRNLNCQSPLSNSRAQSLLETDKYPYAEFAVQQAPGLVLPLTVGQSTALQYLGDQTVHGVTRGVEYSGTNMTTGPEVEGHSTTQIKMTDFNMKPPAIPPLLQVLDEMVVDLDFRAAVAGPSDVIASGE
jgi:polyisoprenoid-binding protein YceI